MTNNITEDGLSPQTIDSENSNGVDIVLPKVKPVRLSEYGKELDKLWVEFEKIRRNGFYAAEENHERPRFSPAFLLHGLTGRDTLTFGKAQEVNGFKFPSRTITFNPPDVSVIQNVCNIGVISSDIELEGTSPLQSEGVEEETSGTADFWIPNKDTDSVTEAIVDLRKRVGLGREYITSLDDSNGSSTVMFAFDTSRPELEPLLRFAMRDNQPQETLWASQFGNRVEFPMPGSGLHLAIPIGLPANYIEYIVINEKSPYWQGEKLDLLKQASICDGHPIPLVSAHTGSLIK